MSVRGLPKGNYVRGPGAAAIPPYGSVEFIDAPLNNNHNDDPVVSSMKADEITFICAGVSGNSYMYSTGYNAGDLDCQNLGKHHVSSWLSIQTAMVRPYPSTAETHGTGVNMVFGNTASQGWCRCRFRALPGFQGASVAYQRYTGSGVVNFSMGTFTNPMTNPGGLCMAFAYKEDDAGYWPNGATGTGWTYATNGTYTAMAYSILSTTEIETPGTVTFSSPQGSTNWGGVIVYLR